ncbi:MAG: PIN domain-containing protein [Actinomycetes bacterium]
MSGRVVVVDANVLYSIELTDLLLTLAAHRLVRVHWSPTILDEVRRNLAKRADLSPGAIAHRIDRMNRAVPGALDEPPEALIEAMPITEHDRHVLALAVHVEADTILTFNLRDFPASACEPHGVEAVDPDSFAVAVAESDPSRAYAALLDIARRRTRPPMTVRELLDRLEVVLPNFVSQVRAGLPDPA